MSCVRYTSVSALCRDARLYYVHRGSARSRRASMQTILYCVVRYCMLWFASVSAQSRDARIPCIRYVGLLHLQQPNIPYTRYASVSALCRDAHLPYMHRGSARSRRASMQTILYCVVRYCMLWFASVSASSRDARIHYVHRGSARSRRASMQTI